MTGGWRARALCADPQFDPELWFPESGSARAAKRICAACPVRAECLAFSLTLGVPVGVWGGLSEKQRRALPAARWRPCKRCGKPARCPEQFCSETCRQAARRQVQTAYDRRKAAA